MGAFDYEGWGVVEEPTRIGKAKIRHAGWVRMQDGKIRIDMREPSGKIVSRWFGLSAVASFTPQDENEVACAVITADTKARDAAEISERVCEILAAVSQVARISIEQLEGRRRTPQRLITYRHLAWYLMRHWTQASYPQIGVAVKRDHSSVMHGVNCAAKRIERGQFVEEIAKVKAIIAQSSAMVMDGLSQEVA